MKEDGTVVVRTRTACERIGASDILVGVLDSAVPSGVAYAQVLPSDWTNYYPTGLVALPTIGLDQELKATVQDGNGFYTGASQVPSDTNRLAYYESKVEGDSGHGSFILVGTNVVFRTHWVTGGAGWGPENVDYHEEINAAITNLGANGYYLEDVDLTGYTDWSL